MQRSSSPTPFKRRILFVCVALVSMLILLLTSVVYTPRALAAAPTVGDFSQTPPGYIAPTDTVNIQFEATSGSSGQIRYTTNNWSSYTNINATKIGTDGSNDVLRATLPTEPARTWVQYTFNATNSSGTTWWTGPDPNDDSHNETYVVGQQVTHRVYQLFVRTFSATGTGKSSTGTFNAITSTDINNIKALGFDTIWLTGVMQQETNSAYGAKGNAGSPYAITDNWNVSSDLGTMSDFTSLVQRIHSANLKVIIDFVGNHTAREYHSTNAGSNAFSTSNYVWVHSDGSLGNDGVGTMAWGNDSHVFPCGTNDWTDTAMLDYHGENANPSDSNSTYSKQNQLVAFWQGKGDFV